MLKNIFCVFLIAIALFLVNTSPVLADIQGEQIFTANCAGCHPKGGNIIRRGKNLKARALKRNQLDSQDAIVSLVTNGKGIMSAYGDRLTAEEIAAVSNYVLEQAANNWR
ncbi:Cytochrome c6-like [Hyella patelloides LEGE 07179]|uniref:Cytochrome c6-like n=1 Tax=Hyella patelloides LEGE 07179 TaxID=945734 RepID=A0A563VJK5_9CYAN|nr:c-type cytochrome [Hyella patelloides]VEP11646.1 Cytochrome c6-like [Hyella patelloides LEGE 07179]